MAWPKPRSLKSPLIVPLLLPLLFRSREDPSQLQTSDSIPGKKIREPFTGIEFDWKKEVSQSEAGGCYRLLGVAVRCMLGQCKFSAARAYAVGLYVEDQGSSCWIYKDNNRDIAETVYDSLINAHVARCLVLALDKDVAGSHIGKGFDRSLLPRIRKAQGSKYGPGKDALREFTSCFSKEKLLHKGSEILLVWQPDDTLVVMIDSRVRAVISSPLLCRVVFDMYLASDSIFKKYRNMAFTFHCEADTELTSK